MIANSGGLVALGGVHESVEFSALLSPNRPSFWLLDGGLPTSWVCKKRIATAIKVRSFVVQVWSSRLLLQILFSVTTFGFKMFRDLKLLVGRLNLLGFRNQQRHSEWGVPVKTSSERKLRKSGIVSKSILMFNWYYCMYLCFFTSLEQSVVKITFYGWFFPELIHHPK